MYTTLCLLVVGWVGAKSVSSSPFLLPLNTCHLRIASEELRSVRKGFRNARSRKRWSGEHGDPISRASDSLLKSIAHFQLIPLIVVSISL